MLQRVTRFFSLRAPFCAKVYIPPAPDRAGACEGGRDWRCFHGSGSKVGGSVCSMRSSLLPRARPRAMRRDWLRGSRRRSHTRARCRKKILVSVPCKHTSLSELRRRESFARANRFGGAFGLQGSPTITPRTRKWTMFVPVKYPFAPRAHTHPRDAGGCRGFPNGSAVAPRAPSFRDCNNSGCPHRPAHARAPAR